MRRCDCTRDSILSKLLFTGKQVSLTTTEVKVAELLAMTICVLKMKNIRHSSQPSKGDTNLGTHIILPESSQQTKCVVPVDRNVEMTQHGHE